MSVSKIPPQDLIDKYTLNGQIRLMLRYANNIRDPVDYSQSVINALFQTATRRKIGYYNTTDPYLYESLDKYYPAGLETAIMGSQIPFYECICISYGGFPVSIDYTPIVCDDKRIRTKTVDEQMQDGERFEAAFSISSFEHDGLGRYGDPLSPDGDLLAMNEMRYILQPQGTLYLSVPIGIDTVVWNMHRVYGKIRLPMLLENWGIVQSRHMDRKRSTQLSACFCIEKYQSFGCNAKKKLCQ